MADNDHNLNPTDLQQYTLSSSCPKCGNTNDNSTSYCKCTFHDREHFVRVCNRCGWQWNEAPRDTAADAAAQQQQDEKDDQYQRQTVHENEIENATAEGRGQPRS